MCFDCVRSQSEKALRREYLDGEPGAERPVVGAVSNAMIADKSAPTTPQAGEYTDDESAVMSALVGAAAGRWMSAGELSERTGIPDRRMRLTIRALVMRGEPIISMPGTSGGFKFVDDAEELAADRARKRREALSLLYRLSRQDRTMVLKELAGQERLMEGRHA
jgi:hypothetical protein